MPEKYLSVENEFEMRDNLLLNACFLLKYPGQSDEEAFGLDRSDVRYRLFISLCKNSHSKESTESNLI